MKCIEFEIEVRSKHECVIIHSMKLYAAYMNKEDHSYGSIQQQ